jgi:hypothetical protein
VPVFSLKFKIYHRFDDRQDGITVPVLLGTTSDSVDLLAKIDTGAEYCFFDREYAKALAIEVEEGELKAIGTVAGSFSAYGHELTIQVLDQLLLSTVYFYADSGFKRNVLGRNGFLNKVRLGVVEYDSAVYCSSYDDE